MKVIFSFLKIDFSSSNGNGYFEKPYKYRY